MRPRVCICCGQPIPEREFASGSWGSHICAACAALPDEMEEARSVRKRQSPSAARRSTKNLPGSPRLAPSRS